MISIIRLETQLGLNEAFSRGKNFSWFFINLFKTKSVNNAYRNKCPCMQNQNKFICADPTVMKSMKVHEKLSLKEARIITFRSSRKIPINR